MLAAVGVLIGVRYNPLGRALAWTGVLALIAFYTPAVSALLLGLLDTGAQFAAVQPVGAQGIVILAGRTRSYVPGYGGHTLGELTQTRMRYGARIFR